MLFVRRLWSCAAYYMLGRFDMSVCSVLVLLLAITGVVASAAADAGAASEVLVIGASDTFADSFKRCAVKIKRVDSPDKAGGLAGYSAVVVCANDYKKPYILSRPFKERLEKYVRNGGCALVEFCVPDDKNLFDVKLDNSPVFARYERIVVSDGLDEAPDVLPDTLLDEQYSYVLKADLLPENCRRILDYGKFVGTYKAKPVPSHFYEFWVDLGKSEKITGASQKYGGQNHWYCPDSVELLAGDSPDNMRSIGEHAGDWKSSQTADFSFPAQKARYVLFRCRRGDTGPGEYWFFAGEITITNDAGENIAFRKPTKVITPVQGGEWGLSLLTDGIIDGLYSDGKSMMLAAVGEDFGVRKWPALFETKFGKGRALVLTSRLSDWEKRHFRPSAAWRRIMHGIALETLPSKLRQRASKSYVPITAYTEPGRWVNTGESVELVVETSDEATVKAECKGIGVIQLQKYNPGKWTAKLRPADGDYLINITARTANGIAEDSVKLWVSDRKTAYKRALQNNMRWFTESGIMPQKDGSGGVKSTIFVPSPDDGPQENMPGAFRTDNEAMCIDTFVLFAKVSGDDAWTERARNLGDRLVKYQRNDLTKADYGSFPWVIGDDGKVKDGHIWFHDNESRCLCALFNLYAYTGDTKYLSAALKSAQLSLDVSREDYTIACHSVSPDTLNNINRSGYRELYNYALHNFDAARWYSAYSVTGDEAYRKALHTVASLYNTGYSTWLGEQVWQIGPYACTFTDAKGVGDRIEEHAVKKMQNEDVAKYGTSLLRGPGAYSLLYKNDSSINTDSEPISDQLYTSPTELGNAWLAYKGGGSKSALKIYTTLADFLVRIQLEDPSPKVNGCWVRAFDTELWEDYGAPYDPNYGPYHAYSGWMNSRISQYLAYYVLDINPLELYKGLWEKSKPCVRLTQENKPPDKVDPANAALNKRCNVSPSPDNGTPDVLTDGIVDGPAIDGRSLLWSIPELGKSIKADVTVDLGEPIDVAMIGMRMGAMNRDYNPDDVTIFAGQDSDNLNEVAFVQAGPAVEWSLWKAIEPVNARFVRISYKKTRFTDRQDKLAVGELVIQKRAGE